MPKYRYTTAELQSMCNNPWLTDRERITFELYHRRGWAIEDVAAELDVSRRTVDNILRSIRDKSI
jgi:DNA-directed RNA polymerase specialized sigma24 family protein